jgi:hypothetical protein
MYDRTVAISHLVKKRPMTNSARTLGIAGALLTMFAAAACMTDSPSGVEDDQVVDPAADDTLETEAAVSPAELALPTTANHTDADPLRSAKMPVTTQACTTTCRDVVHPELCLFIPFPFCLIPQHECTTLCDCFSC